MQSALAKVSGVKEVVSVDRAAKKAVVKAEKGKVSKADLVKAVADSDARFTAKVIEE